MMPLANEELQRRRRDFEVEAELIETIGARASTIIVEAAKLWEADLIVINGNPAANIADVRNVETVFKRGVGFDSAKLIESVKGKVGLW